MGITPLVAALRGSQGQQPLHVLPDGGQVAVLEGDDKPPTEIAADLEEALIGIQAIDGQTEREPGILLFELGRQADERLAFAILFIIRTGRIGDPFGRQRDCQPGGGDQLGFQHWMKISRFPGR